MTPDQNFKGTPLFDIEYLKNDTRYTWLLQATNIYTVSQKTRQLWQAV